MAQRGAAILLVETRIVDGRSYGRIWDRRRGSVGEEQLVASVAKFGYWTEYDGEQPSTQEWEAALAAQERTA